MEWTNDRVRIHRDAARVRTSYPAWALWLGAAAAAAGGTLLAFLHALPAGERVAAALVAASFVACGGWLALLALRSARARRRLAEASARGEPRWTFEHPWTPPRARDESWRRVGRSASSFAFLAAFLAPFHLLFLGDGAPGGLTRVPLAALALFDLAAAAVGAHAAYLLFQRRKFGETEVVYEPFPLVAGGAAGVTFLGGPRLASRSGLRAELHCVEELYEQEGHGDSRTIRFAAESLTRAQTRFETDPLGAARLRFDIPADAPGTRLATDGAVRPRFWELVVTSDEPGIDFEGVYLLPIYTAAP